MGLNAQARSSVAECFLDAEEVEGSIPSAPTIYIRCVFGGRRFAAFAADSFLLWIQKVYIEKYEYFGKNYGR